MEKPGLEERHKAKENRKERSVREGHRRKELVEEVGRHRTDLQVVVQRRRLAGPTGYDRWLAQRSKYVHCYDRPVLPSQEAVEDARVGQQEEVVLHTAAVAVDRRSRAGRKVVGCLAVGTVDAAAGMQVGCHHEKLTSCQRVFQTKSGIKRGKQA